MGWLYQRGLAAGASYTTFEPDARCTAQMYATFMLRALGYSDQKNDFTYINALRFAAQVGLIDLFSCDTDDFRRDDAVQMSRMALTMTRKGEREDLLASLTAAGAVDADRAAAFRQTAQPDADLQAALAKRKPYIAKVFAALQAGDFPGGTHAPEPEQRRTHHGGEPHPRRRLFPQLQITTPQQITQASSTLDAGAPAPGAPGKIPGAGRRPPPPERPPGPGDGG